MDELVTCPECTLPLVHWQLGLAPAVPLTSRTLNWITRVYRKWMHGWIQPLKYESTMLGNCQIVLTVFITKTVRWLQGEEVNELAVWFHISIPHHELKKMHQKLVRNQWFKPQVNLQHLVCIPDCCCFCCIGWSWGRMFSFHLGEK